MKQDWQALYARDLLANLPRSYKSMSKYIKFNAKLFNLHYTILDVLYLYHFCRSKFQNVIETNNTILYHTLHK